MENMSTLKQLALAAVIFGLTACGGGGGSDGGDDGDGGTDTPTDLTILEFGVAGSGGEEPDGTAIIDANRQMGVFGFDWKMVTSDPYLAGVYVSEDDQLDTNDTAIFVGNCDWLGIYPCHKESAIGCRFDTQNIIDCEYHDPVDMTMKFGALPFRGHIILRVCDALATECRIATHPVVFM